MPYAIPLGELLAVLENHDPPQYMRAIVCGVNVIAALKSRYPEKDFETIAEFPNHIVVSGEEAIPTDSIYLLNDEGAFYEEDPRNYMT